MLSTTPVHYHQSICLPDISNILRSSHFSPGPEGYISVLRNEEDTATKLINGLTSLCASAECLSKAVPFLSASFWVCDVSGVAIQSTSSQCKEIRDTTCPQQWVFLDKLDIGLPDCEILPAETLSCPTMNETLSTNGTVIASMLGKLIRICANFCCCYWHIIII